MENFIFLGGEKKLFQFNLINNKERCKYKMENDIINLIIRIVKLFFSKIPYSFEALSGVIAFLAYYNILLGLYSRIKGEKSKKTVNTGIRIFSCVWVIICMVFAYRGNLAYFVISMQGMYIARDAFGFAVNTENFDKTHFILGLFFLLLFLTIKIVKR